MSDTPKFDWEKLGAAMHQLGDAVLNIGYENGLNHRQMYLAVMFVSGGFAAANKVPIDYPPAVETFKDGYHSYESFMRGKHEPA